MPAPAFTVLLPVHRGPELLPFAIDSVLAQERQDFELIVICDGAPGATADYAREAAKRDARIRVNVHPKGERHGEIYRHQALERAEGRFVCHLCDDDLWFPNHLSEMALLLEEIDFGNVPQLVATGKGALAYIEGDLSLQEVRAAILGRSFSFFGLSTAGYRLDAYRRLPVGWTPAPPDFWTDVYMWRKFLALPGIRCATRVAVTNMTFPAPQRKEWPMEKRVAEHKRWSKILKAARNRDRISQEVLKGMMHAEIARRNSARQEKNANAARS